MSVYEDTAQLCRDSYYNNVNNESHYFNNTRLMDLEHSWGSNYCADIKSQDCYHGLSNVVVGNHMNQISTNNFYRSPSYCPGSSSELDDMDRHYHDGLFNTSTTPPNAIATANTPMSTASTSTTTPTATGPITPGAIAPVRVIKKRNTANKKERRRTQSINNAFSCLRDKIPNVPADTKLSKIKTLKLAILYIKYLVDVLDGEQDPKNDFRAELKPLHRKHNSCDKRAYFTKSDLKNAHRPNNKGRTGWPQDVWASELVPEQK